MQYNPNIRSRKSIRLKEYDYTKEGMYFITICTKNREKILSKIEGSVKTDPYIKLTNIGVIVEENLKNISRHFYNIKINDYVIMPNHLHLIIEIVYVGVGLDQPKITIPQIIGLFKSGVTRIFNQKYGCNDTIWQRNYYEHIIRNEKEYLKILEYIQNNPLKWSEDEYNS